MLSRQMPKITDRHSRTARTNLRKARRKRHARTVSRSMRQSTR